jgi:hypothetical protein
LGCFAIVTAGDRIYFYVSIDQFEPFKHLFTITFNAEYVDIFKITVGLVPIDPLVMHEYVKNVPTPS